MTIRQPYDMIQAKVRCRNEFYRKVKRSENFRRIHTAAGSRCHGDHEQHLLRLRDGKRQPDVAKIKQLAKILKTSGDFLLETGFVPVGSEEDKTDISCCHEDYVADIFANFELLDNDYKNVVENLIIQLLDIQKKNRQTQTNKK